MLLNLRSSDSRFTWVETTSPLKAVPGIILDCRHWVWGEVKDVLLASSGHRPGIHCILWCARWPPGTENDLAQMSAVLRLTNHPPELPPLAEEIYKEPPNTLVNRFWGPGQFKGEGEGRGIPVLRPSLILTVTHGFRVLLGAPPCSQPFLLYHCWTLTSGCPAPS